MPVSLIPRCWTSPSVVEAAFAKCFAGLRIALAVDRFDWHARELTRALVTLGVRAVPFRLSATQFDTSAKFGLRIRGFGPNLPDAVIVRAVSGGTFQAVTMRLGILHALRELGVPVWNDARAIERCVDKSTTSFLMANAGIPTPDTWCVESLDAARALVRREVATRPAGSQALVRVAGPRTAAYRENRGSSAARGGRGRLLSPAFRRRRP